MNLWIFSVSGRTAVASGSLRKVSHRRVDVQGRAGSHLGPLQPETSPNKDQYRFSRRVINQTVFTAFLSTGFAREASAKTKELPADVYPKVDAIKRLMKLFLARNFDGLEALTTPDALVRVQAPGQLPYSGKYTGQSCVRDFMTQFNTSFNILSAPEVFYYVNESGSVFVACDFVLQSAKNSSFGLETSMTMKLKVDADGKLTKWSIISDTLAAYNVLQDVQAAAEYESQL